MPWGKIAKSKKDWEYLPATDKQIDFLLNHNAITKTDVELINRGDAAEMIEEVMQDEEFWFKNEDMDGGPL